MRYALVPAAVLVAALALVAAGCGSSSQSAEEQWADSVCTPILKWQKQVKQLVSDVKSGVSSPQSGTVDALKSAGQQAAMATKTLASDLKGLPPAPGDGGQSAKQTLTALGSQLGQIADALQSSLSALSSSASVSAAVGALQSAATQISPLVTQAGNTLDSLEQTSSQLKSGFQDASSCQELKKS